MSTEVDPAGKREGISDAFPPYERYIVEPVSPRIQSLRERLFGRQFVEGMGSAPKRDLRGCTSRGEPFHAGWMSHPGEGFDVRLAEALASWWRATKPDLDTQQLIQGSPPPEVAIAFYTGGPWWDFHLDEGLLGSDPSSREIGAYWREYLRGRPAIPGPAALSLPGISDALGITGKFCHSSQAYDLAIAHGLDGLVARVEAAAPSHPKARSWYEAIAIAIRGAGDYIVAHAEAADALPGEEWRSFAGDCRRIAHLPPESFRQAVQLFYFLFLLNGHDSPGRIDQYLAVPLLRDLESEELEIEAAQEIVDSLYLRFAERVCYGSTIGGQLPEGGDATSPLTWLCLNSIRRLRLLSPRTALRRHSGTPPELYRETIRSIASGATYPTLVNDEAMVPSMLRRGATLEHARDYTFAGCGQVIPQGRAHGSYEDVILSAAKPLAYALHDGRDERTGLQVGPATGESARFTTFEALEEAVWKQFTFLVETGIEATNAIRRWSSVHLRDFLRSALTHSCLENGLDWRAGGADYHDGMVDVVGLTTLTDSLLVLRRLVYEERRLGLGEFVELLDRDWEGDEALRRYCLERIPKFGNEDTEADEMLRRWITRINEWLFTKKTAFGGRWGMDIIGWSGAVRYGALSGATPDGRRAGESIADCAGPAQGRDRSGVTAVLNSMLTLPMLEVHGPLALSLRVPANSVDTFEGREKLGALIASYFERGGQQVQVTVASAEEMREAQRSPELHRDLMVRVGGFSAYFVELTRDFQEEMIRRSEHCP